MENSTGKISPWLASPVTSPVRARHSAPMTTTNPMRVAMTTSSGEFNDPESSAPMAIPGSTAWDIASTSIDWWRSTRKIPGTEQVTAVTMANSRMDVMSGMSVPLCLCRQCAAPRHPDLGQ